KPLSSPKTFGSRITTSFRGVGTSCNTTSSGPARSIKRNHNLGIGGGSFAPGAKNRRRLFNRRGRADGLSCRKPLLFKHADHLFEVLGLRVARAEDVELFLHKQARLVADLIPGVSDVDDAAGKGDLLDRSAKCAGPSDGFDDYVGAVTTGDLLEPGMAVVTI